MNSRFRHIPLLVMFAASVGACADLGKGARLEFSRELSCPEDRIEVRERPDLRYSRLFAPDSEMPPADIANDPERIAVWRAHREKDRAELNEALDRLDMFEVRGCEARRLLGCGYGGDSEGATSSGTVVCFKPPLQDVP